MGRSWVRFRLSNGRVPGMLVLSAACLILAGAPMTTQAASSAGNDLRDPTSLTPEPTPLGTPRPSGSPVISPAPSGTIPLPEQTSVTVGYSDTSFVGRIALALADARGYFTDAGFQDVTFMNVAAPLPGLLNGSLDFALLDTTEAATGFSLGLPVRAIAGHRIGVIPAIPAASAPPPSAASASAAPDVGMVDLLATTSDAIQGRPATVTAFTSAYVRALRDLHALLDAGDPQSSASPGVSPVQSPSASPVPSLGPDELFQFAADAGIEVPDALRADWRQSLAVLSPDGGFGSLADDGGLGTLRRSLTSDTVVLDGPDGFLWTDGLHAAQRWLGLPENPSPTPAPSPPSPSGSLVPTSSAAP